MVIERFDQGLGVDDAAAGRIDEEASFFYFLYIFPVDEVMGVLVVGDVERHDIRLCEHLVERRIPIVEYFRKEDIMIDIGGDDVHAESLGDADDVEPDMAGADDAERFVFEIEAHEAVDGKIFFQPPGVGFVDIAGEGENKGKSMLSHGIFSVMRNIGNRYIFFSADSDIDVVEAGGTGGDEADVFQLFDDGVVDCRIDEHGNDLITSGMRRVFFCQRFGGEKKFVFRKHSREVVLVRRAGFKKGDFHNEGRVAYMSDFVYHRTKWQMLSKKRIILYYTPKLIFFANTRFCR